MGFVTLWKASYHSFSLFVARNLRVVEICRIKPPRAKNVMYLGAVVKLTGCKIVLWIYCTGA
jgi:hypothetical protein